MFLDEHVVQRLRAMTDQIGEDWMALRAMSRESGHMRWAVTTKVHKMMHTWVYALALNPRYIQVYSEESLVGSVARVYSKSVAGRYAREVQTLVLLKRYLGLILRFELYY